jgi:diguanylate cyclase (GGDEF)-like protein
LGQDFVHSEFALLMADINNLKVINDTYGHKEGDKYIQNCCKILCNTFKHSAVFRIGGDEFVVLVQNSDYEDRNALYAKLKLTFDSNYYNTDAPLNKRYSMAIGIGNKRDNDITMDRMFKDADRMMYDNKKKLKSGNTDTLAEE